MGVNMLFERGASLYPDRLCLVDAETSHTYRRVAERRDQIAAALRASGVQGGDRCAVYSPNCVAAFECLLGIYRAAGVFVPLNPKSQVDESIYVVAQSGVSMIFYHSSLADDIRALRLRCAGVVLFVCIDRECDEDRALDDWVDASAADVPASVYERDRLCSIYSTGGTTGRPKGVMFSALTWEVMAANMYSVMDGDEPPVYLAVSPMTHAAGTLAILLMASGATVLIHPGFDAGAVLGAIAEHRVTHLYLPPTAIYMLLEHPALHHYDYASLKAFIYTSAPMSSIKLKKCLAVFGPVMIQFWGQTEAPIFCTALTQADHVAALAGNEKRLTSCGRPMLLTPVEVMDDEGNLLPCDVAGELVVRGNLVMTGYYNNSEATREASRWGWHHTGDIGFKDRDGYVYIVDRKKDMIISGGFNVYPSEVEQVILEQDGVQGCAVIGAPDEKWGEAVTAVLELAPHARVSVDAVIAQCKQRLGSVKAPKAVLIWPQLPRTSVGKIDKKQIREQFWVGQQRNI